LCHGEAVIWGMRAAVRLSVARAKLSIARASEIEDFLAGIPVPETKVKTAALLAAASKDKKARRGRLRFVLLKESAVRYCPTQSGLRMSSERSTPSEAVPWFVAHGQQAKRDVGLTAFRGGAILPFA
jgi:3-dehydroquinate synthetase